MKLLEEVCQHVHQASEAPQLDVDTSTRLLYFLHKHRSEVSSADEVLSAVVSAVSGRVNSCTPQQLLILLPLLSHQDPDLAETVSDTACSGAAASPADMAVPEANLAGVVEELGPPCTASKASFLGVLRQFPKVDDASAGQLMAAMCSTGGAQPSPTDPYGVNAVFSAVLSKDGDSDGSADTYKVDVAVEALAEYAPGLDWKAVARRLDNDAFLLKDVRGFVNLVNGVKRGLGGAPFPLEAVLSSLWSNPAGQLSFLAHAVAAPPEVLTFQSYGRCAPPLERLHSGKSPVGTPNHAWLSLDLLEMLGRLAEAGLKPSVHALLEHPLKHCPEVLLAGLAGCRPDVTGALRSEVSNALMPSYVANNPNSMVVLHRVWPLNREAVLSAMAELFSQDPTSMSRVLDVCQELKALTEVRATPRTSLASAQRKAGDWQGR